jgi:hypothetical protein
MRKILPDLTESKIKGEIVHRFAVVLQVMPKDAWLQINRISIDFNPHDGAWRRFELKCAVAPPSPNRA